MKKILVLVDRDGVLIYDDKYHLGRTNNWKKKVKVLPKVVEGLKKLRKIKGVSVYMITNQPGIAVKNFPLLTMKRSSEVCKFVVDKLKKKGGLIDDYFVCPHASPAYTKKRKTYKFEKKLVCNCSCIKPRLGMVFNALKKEGITKENANIYVIGDRISDIKTALNIKGNGILVPFANEPGQIEMAKKIKQKSRVYIAKDFLGAANFIVTNEKSRFFNVKRV